MQPLSINDRKVVQAAIKELEAANTLIIEASALPECPMTTDESKLLGQIESQIVAEPSTRSNSRGNESQYLKHIRQP